MRKKMLVQFLVPSTSGSPSSARRMGGSTTEESPASRPSRSLSAKCARPHRHFYRIGYFASLQQLQTYYNTIRLISCPRYLD